MAPMSPKFLRPRRRPPNAPRMLFATESEGVSWTRPGDNGSPIIEFRLYADGVILEQLLGSETIWLFLATPGVLFQVSAVNAVGESALSLGVVAT